MELGAGESVRQTFGNYCLTGLRCRFRHDLSTKPLRIEKAATDTQVMHMHDWRPSLACGCQQTGNLRKCPIQSRQRKNAAAVLFLHIDDQQGRIRQRRRVVAAATELKHGLWLGHFRLLVL